MTENPYPVTGNRPQIQAVDVTPVSMMFDPVISGRVMTIAETLAKGRVSVPDHLRGNVGDCLAIVMQSASWRLNPFAVAQKTHLIHGRLGYEAQLVSAVVSSLRIIEGRFSYEYIGDWDKLAKPPIIRKSSKGFEIPTPGWKPEDEDGLALIVSAKIRGEPEVKKHKLTLASVWPRNSTLWATNPGQQASYLATKQWVRKYTPDALLGVYTTDELEQQSERVVSGERVSEDAAQSIMDEARKIESAEPPINPMMEEIENAKTILELHKIGESMLEKGMDRDRDLVDSWKQKMDQIGHAKPDTTQIGEPQEEKQPEESSKPPASEETKPSHEPKPDIWPKELHGYLIDARGVVWDERVHSSGKVCTQEGHWRRRRGQMPSKIKEMERTIEQLMAEDRESESEKTEELPAQSQEQQQINLDAEKTETPTEMFSEEWFRQKIPASETKADLEEYLDLLNECDFPEGVMADLEDLIAEHPANA